VHRDPEDVLHQYEQETVEEIERDADRVPAEVAAARRSSDEEESAGDGDVDDERIDRRAERVAEGFGETVDEVRDAEPDG